MRADSMSPGQPPAGPAPPGRLTDCGVDEREDVGDVLRCSAHNRMLSVNPRSVMPWTPSVAALGGRVGNCESLAVSGSFPIMDSPLHPY